MLKSRVLRKDTAIVSRNALSKTEQATIDNEIDQFIKNIPTIEKKLKSSSVLEESGPSYTIDDLPIRTSSLKINSTKMTNESKSTETKPQLPKQAPNGSTTATKNKPVKPRDYREWEK